MVKSIGNTNIDPNDPYEFPGGKCSDEYAPQDRRKILEGNAQELDMGQAPNADDSEDKGEKNGY